MPTNEILKLVEWYASRRVDHFRLATRETSHDLRVALDAIAAALSQAEADRVDAERYRWLRNSANSCTDDRAPMVFNAPYGAGDIRWQDCQFGDELDAEVDARLTKAVKTEG